MSENLFQEIESKLGDGWGVTLISTVTPGIVRIQLCGKDEMYEARACVEGHTLEQAIENAVRFTKSTDVDEWESKFWNAAANAGDEPFCACPQCDWSLSFEDGGDDKHRMSNLGYHVFTCERCGTTSTWDLDSELPILISKTRTIEPRRDDPSEQISPDE